MAKASTRTPRGPALTTVTPQPGDRTRAAVLQSVVRARRPVTAEEVAASTGRHANTARAHLDHLADEGTLLRLRAPQHGRGRPAWTYSPAPTQNLDLREHLDQVLAGLGFGPRRRRDRSQTSLTTCPVVDAARADQEAVCGSHLALLRAVVESHTPGSGERLELRPFATREACLLTLRPGDREARS